MELENIRGRSVRSQVPVNSQAPAAGQLAGGERSGPDGAAFYAHGPAPPETFPLNPTRQTNLF